MLNKKALNNLKNNFEDNTEIFREKLSEMDKVFIPDDIDDNDVSLEDLVSYKSTLKFWRIVPERYCLVTKNIFTQENRNVQGHGLKFVAPLFTKAILVPYYTGVKKYTKVSAITKDCLEVKVDFDIIMKIEDPAKYLAEGKNRSDYLDSLISRLIRKYIFTKFFEDTLQGECLMEEFDPDGQLITFFNSYGIAINKVIIEKTELPEEIKKLYTDVAEEEQRKKAQSIRLQAEKEKAQSDADIARLSYVIKAEEIKTIETVKNELLAQKIANLTALLKNQGVSEEQIDTYIRTLILADKGNAIFMGNNLDAQNIAAGIAGGETAKNLRTR